MKIKKIFQKFSVVGLYLTLIACSVFAQKPGNTIPRQEKLLNGLKVLIWNIPSAEKVSVKVRVHSGSAFDPQEREGVVRLLSDSIFPNQAAREFFAETRIKKKSTVPRKRRAIKFERPKRWENLLSIAAHVKKDSPKSLGFALLADHRFRLSK